MSAALKAGDKVKVEFEGTVEGATYDNVSIWVRRDDGLDNYVRIADLVKIVPPEPVWEEGDVILFNYYPGHTPELFVFSPAADSTYPWQRPNAPRSGNYPSTISRGWADGRVTRMLPEVAQ